MMPWSIKRSSLLFSAPAVILLPPTVTVFSCPDFQTIFTITGFPAKGRIRLLSVAVYSWHNLKQSHNSRTGRKQILYRPFCLKSDNSAGRDIIPRKFPRSFSVLSHAILIFRSVTPAYVWAAYQRLADAGFDRYVIGN